MSPVFWPELPPSALLHYRELEVVCQRLGEICEYLEKTSGRPVGELVRETPHFVATYLRGVVFQGPWAPWWNALVEDSLPPVAVRWTADGKCELYESCVASHMVFLMSPGRALFFIKRSPSVTKRLKKLGIPINAVLQNPVEVVKRIAEDIPQSPEELAGCKSRASSMRGRRLTPLAMLKYWAVHEADPITDALLRGRPPVKLLNIFQKRG